jgi:glyoxylase-like metal-dependent hydrolase (beta-lactamase superfamily II)
MKRTIISVVFGITMAGTALAQEPVWDGNKVVLETQKLAEGVYAVIPSDAGALAPKGYPVATTGGFVIGKNGVLVVESMLNQRLNDQLFDLIAAETDKPVRYLVNTSFHGDHSYGNMYVPENINIIQHEVTANYIANHLDGDKQFMIKNFGKGRGIEEIQATQADILISKGSQLTIDLGDRKVEIKDFGFAQTGGDLFVSVPSANILWTGNAVVAQAPALPWLLDGHLVETKASLTAVYDNFDANTKVVPGHGLVTDMGAVKWNIDYLAAVESGVQAAITKGLSLEQTVAEVQLPDFQGYALFGWVHPSLNIPAAYKDLK